MEEPLDRFEEEQNEDLHMGLKIVAFIFPIVGAIMYFYHQKSNPTKSKSACTSALWGVGVGLIFRVIAAML